MSYSKCKLPIIGEIYVDRVYCMIKKILEFIKTKILRQEGNAGIDSFLTDMKSELENFSTVFDIGAYQGHFVSQVLKAGTKIKIHVFEPFQESFSILQSSFKGQQNVILNKVAVSNTSKRSYLNVNSFKETNSLLDSASIDQAIDALTKTESVQAVDVICLDEYCHKNKILEIDLIKIDTQGNSYNVLLGLSGMLQLKKVKYLYVEAEFAEIYKDEKLFSEIELLMRDFGYSIVKLYNINYIDQKRLGWCDVLFSSQI